MNFFLKNRISKVQMHLRNMTASFVHERRKFNV